MNEEWEKLNRAYWDAWKALAEAAPGGAGTGSGKRSAQASNAPPPPWSEALDAWWRAASGSVPEPERTNPAFAVFEQVVDQSRQMFAFAEMMRDAFEDPGDRPPVEKFAENLRDAIGSWRVASRAAEFAAPFMQGPFAPPSAGSANPFAAFAAPYGGGGAQRRYRLRDDWDPRDFSRVFAEYQIALNAVAEQQFRALGEAVDRFTSSPAARETDAGTDDALKRWYDTWVKSFDAALGDLSSSDQYSEHFGGLVNAYLRLQQMLWSPDEDAAPEYATRADAEAIGDKVEAVDTRCDGLAARLDRMPLENLKAHVSELTDEIHELREAIASLEAARVEAESGRTPSTPSERAEPDPDGATQPARRKKKTGRAKSRAKSGKPDAGDDLDISTFTKS